MKSFSNAETQVLHDTLQDVVDIKANIEQACQQLNVSLEQAPASSLRSEKLYKILVCYEELYKKLQQYELVKLGCNFKNINIH